MNIVWILELNRKLFPFLVIIFLILILIDSLNLNYFKLYPKLLNLDYKLLIILVSGILVLMDYYLKKKPNPQQRNQSF